MYTDDDLLPISALQHWLFCRRQCGLIHLEQIWDENRLTAEGRLLHEKVHEADTGPSSSKTTTRQETRPGIRIVRGLRIHSYRLGLVGQADVVEFHKDEGKSEKEQTQELKNPGTQEFKKWNFVESIDSSHPFGMTSNRDGPATLTTNWRVVPVEYKRGSPKIDSCDEVQLCAQAMCLEEMLRTAIPQGAFFYGKPRRRKEIEIGDALRQETEAAVRELHALIKSGVTPTVRYEKKCEACSLYNRCMPKMTGVKKKVAGYLEKAYEIFDFRGSIDD